MRENIIEEECEMTELWHKIQVFTRSSCITNPVHIKLRNHGSKGDYMGICSSPGVYDHVKVCWDKSQFDSQTRMPVTQCVQLGIIHG